MELKASRENTNIIPVKPDPVHCEVCKTLCELEPVGPGHHVPFCPTCEENEIKEMLEEEKKKYRKPPNCS